MQFKVLVNVWLIKIEGDIETVIGLPVRMIEDYLK